MGEKEREFIYIYGRKSVRERENFFLFMGEKSERTRVFPHNYGAKKSFLFN